MTFQTTAVADSRTLKLKTVTAICNKISFEFVSDYLVCKCTTGICMSAIDFIGGINTGFSCAAAVTAVVVVAVTMAVGIIGNNYH